MKTRIYVAGHALLFAAAVAIACIGIGEIVSGGSLAQGLIRLVLAFAVVASQLRGIYWDRRDAARKSVADMENLTRKVMP